MEVEDDYNEPLTNSTFLETLEEAHVIDLNDTTYDPSKEFMSLNPSKPFSYYESLSLLHPELISWDTTKPHNIPHFDTDHNVFIYLNMVKPFCPQRTK